MNNKLYQIVNARRFGIVLTPGMRVLDFGCGEGALALELKGAGFDVHGVDIDERAIVKARNRAIENGFPEAMFNHIANGIIPFPADFFHYAYANQVIEHVRDLDQALRELARVLRKGGGFYSASPAKYCLTEPHIFVPFAHWLPPGKFRAIFIQKMSISG